MSADSPIHPDLAALAETLADRIAGPLQIAMVELAALLHPAKPVRAVPADRWAGDSLANCPIVAFQLIGGALDRRAVRITNPNAAGTIWLSASNEGLGPTGGTGCYPVAPGQTVLLETTASIYACASVAAMVVGWIVEEYDPQTIVGS